MVRSRTLRQHFRNRNPLREDQLHESRRRQILGLQRDHEQIVSEPNTRLIELDKKITVSYRFITAPESNACWTVKSD